MTARKTISKPLGYAFTAASLCSMLVLPATQAFAADAASAKHETIHATTSANGSVNNIVVDTVLESGGSTSVADSSNLYRVESSDEKIWSSNDGGLVWHSEDGRDITYSGTSNTALPVQVKVSYTLDGKDITPQELSGKSGHVVIRYEYLDAEQATSGTAKYAPFAAVTCVPLDPSLFGNVQATNGRVVRDGDVLYALGGGVTGSLEALDEDQRAALPTFFQVEADVSSFHLGTVTTVASCDLFGALKGDLTLLGTASQKVTKKIEEYVKQIEEVRKSVEEIQKTAESLANGLRNTSQLSARLDAATKELSKNNDAIESIKTQSDAVMGAATDAESAAVEFYDFIGSMEDLTDEQRQALYDKWNELGVSGKAEQVVIDAGALKEATSDLDFSATSDAAKNLKATDFSKLAADGTTLSDKLKEILEKGFGPADTKEKGTLFGDAAELKEHLLDDLNEALELPERTTEALAASNLLVTSQTPAKKSTNESGKASDGTVAMVNRVIDEVFNTLSTEIAAEQANKDAFTNYGGITDGTTGTVQVVFETAAIG